MIPPGVLSIEPWAVTEADLHLDHLAQTESIFALSNGHIGLRGNLDEGEPHGIPGTYLNGFFETVPLPYAERGYGYPEHGQSLIDVTNGKLVRLLVDDEPFDIRQGSLLRHERRLDLRAGVLRREAVWESPGGKTVRVQSTRLVSFVQRAVAAICYDVEVLRHPSRIVVQSTLVANEPFLDETDDPRSALALRAPLVGEYHRSHDLEVGLGHRTRVSDLRMAAALDHLVEGPAGTVTDGESEPDLARMTVSTELAPGERLRVVKFMAYGWSSSRSMPALRDQVDAALAAAKRAGWGGLRDAQRRYLDDFWERADVEVDGDDQLQQAVRFGLFQVVQSSARAEKRAIPAKGLTGRGYDGHTFWDMEAYTLPVLTYTLPGAVRDALLWRHSTLPLAQARAAELKLAGASFPWRTIRGEECSGYWPAGTAAFHINADVADAVRRYVAATGDNEFERGPGFDLLIETARLWRRLGHHDAEGTFRIDGVTGPDEYSALADNNTFTNLMAARNLRAAADVADRYPRRAAEAGVDAAEVSSWRTAAGAMAIPFDEALGVTAQADGFTRYRRWDFAGTGAEQYPLLLHHPYYRLELEPGCEAGRPGVRPVPVRRPVQRRAEAPRLRLLRADHRARLVAVGLHPGDRGGRGGPSRPRIRLLPRDGAGRPAGPRRQHRRRPAPGIAVGRLAGGRRRLRRPARPRRPAALRAVPRPGAEPRRVRPGLPRAAPARGGHPLGRALRAPERCADGDLPPRGVPAPGGRRAAGRHVPARDERPADRPAQRQAGAPRRTRTCRRAVISG